MKLSESVERRTLTLEVPDHLLEEVKDFFVANRSYIESERIIGNSNSQETKQITLYKEYKNMDLKGFMSVIKYKVGFAEIISLETFNFLSQFGINQNSLKDILPLIEDRAYFNKALNSLDKSINLANIEEIRVEDILPESSVILLQRGFNKQRLLKVIFNSEQSFDLDNQVANIKKLIEEDEFSWDEISGTMRDASLYKMELELLSKLVHESNMPVDKALFVSQYCTINDVNVKTSGAMADYEKFIQSICNSSFDVSTDTDQINIYCRNFSLQTLEAILRYECLMQSVLVEVFRRIDDVNTDINSKNELIELLSRNKQKAVDFLNKLEHKSDYASQELMQDLVEKQILAKEILLNVNEENDEMNIAGEID